MTSIWTLSPNPNIFSLYFLRYYVSLNYIVTQKEKAMNFRQYLYLHILQKKILRPPVWDLFLRRGAPFLNSYVYLSSSVRACVCHTFYMYGKTLPLFMSDIFSQIFSKCRIFPDIVSGRDIFIFSYLWFLSNIFSQMIIDLQWSMVFNDHSMLLHRDYY